MGRVRLILLIVGAFGALAIAAAASAARPGPPEDGTLSVRDGRGLIQVRLTGGVIGRFGSGKLTVTDSLSDTETVVVRGADRVRDLTARTTVYWGTNIRFRIADERKITIKINAAKINLSAVGLGDVWLDGRGDHEGVYFDGSYSLNGGAYKSIPDLREHFDLEAPPTSG